MAFMVLRSSQHQERHMSDQSDDFRQADGRFAEGNPGGPGRPPLRDRAAVLDLLAAEAGPDLIDVALKEAKEGNLKAVEMMLARIWPVRRGRPVEVEAPPVRATADLLPVCADLSDAILNGDVTPEEGVAAARVVEAHRKMIVTVDHEQRIRELEEETEHLAVRRPSNGSAQSEATPFCFRFRRFRAVLLA
jgi:hypothetical protein